jgi:VanZ family protein
MCEYGLFAILLFRALSNTLSRTDFIWIASLTVIVILAYGISDEFHQSFVPHRDADLKDVAADGFGAIAAMTSIFIKRKVCGK